MPQFLIETYIPRDAPDVAALRAGDAALAAEQARQEGAQIRFLHAIFVPEDETTIAQPSVYTVATGRAPAVTWYNGSASATAAPPAAPGTAVPLMGLPGRDAIAQLMGPADPGAADRTSRPWSGG